MFITYAFVLLLVGSAGAATTDEVHTCRQKYLTELDQVTSNHAAAVSNLQGKYRAALADMKTKAQSQGNLDLTLAVVAEQKRFELAQDEPADAAKTESAEVRNLRNEYTQRLSRLEVEKARKSVALITSCDKTLDGFQKTLTKEGKLDDAVAVAEERKELKDGEAFVSATRVLSLSVKADAQKAPPKEESPPVAPWISTAPPPQAADGWITLFDGAKLYACSVPHELITSGKVSVENGALRVDDVSKGVTFDLKGRDVIIRAQVKNISARSLGLRVRKHDDGTLYGAGCIGGGDSFVIGKNVQGEWADIAFGRSGRSDHGFFDMELSAIGNTLTLKAEGRIVVRAVDHSIDDGRFNVGSYRGVSLFRRIEARVLDKEAAQPPTPTPPSPAPRVVELPLPKQFTVFVNTCDAPVPSSNIRGYIHGCILIQVKNTSMKVQDVVIVRKDLVTVRRKAEQVARFSLKPMELSETRCVQADRYRFEVRVGDTVIASYDGPTEQLHKE